MSAAMAEVLGPRHIYYLFDSCEGLPPGDPVKDGPRAVAYQANPGAPDYFENCRVDTTFLEEAMRRTAVPDVRFIKGWYRT
jgi:hypothetical protein